MTETEKAIRDFCGHHADWWPSTTQVQEMLALAQPEQEPVAWLTEERYAQLHTAQRTWVGLTDDEVYRIAFELEGEHWRKIVDAIEAKLKEKNT